MVAYTYIISLDLMDESYYYRLLLCYTEIASNKLRVSSAPSGDVWFIPKIPQYEYIYTYYKVR